MSSDSLAHRIPMQFGAHWFSCLKAPWDASWQIPGVQDQAGSSSNLFPGDINFASILFQVTFGTAAFTKAMNGDQMKHLRLQWVKAAGFGWATRMSFQCQVPVMGAVVQRVYPSSTMGNTQHWCWAPSAERWTEGTTSNDEV